MHDEQSEWTSAACDEGQRAPCASAIWPAFPWCMHFAFPSREPCERGVRWMPWSFRRIPPLAGGRCVTRRRKRTPIRCYDGAEDTIGCVVCDVAPWIPAPWRRWAGDLPERSCIDPDRTPGHRGGVYEIRCRPDSRGTHVVWPRCVKRKRV